MRNLLITLAIVPLAACGYEGGDTTELTAEEQQSRPSTSNVDFGNDSSMWANDGECDDPRFKGPGMTTTPLLEEDTRADATDCRTAYERGDLTLIE